MVTKEYTYYRGRIFGIKSDKRKSYNYFEGCSGTSFNTGRIRRNPQNIRCVTLLLYAEDLLPVFKWCPGEPAGIGKLTPDLTHLLTDPL